MRSQKGYKGLITLVLLVACNSINEETNNSISDRKRVAAPYLFQDTTIKGIKRYMFEGGYEGAILEQYRKENTMFPFSSSHTRLKVILTRDSTFVVNHLFFKNLGTDPDTVIYFLRRDHPENSYFLRKDAKRREESIDTSTNLVYERRQIIRLRKRDYEIFKFKSEGREGTEGHVWLPDIGIIKLEAKVYDKSFVLSFTADDFRTKVIKDVLLKANL